MQIHYTAGYKYQLYKTYCVEVPIYTGKNIVTDFITLSRDGLMTISAGYAWDGPSGPTIDTSDFMRGSLVHDALYQLMREGHLNRGIHRPIADKLLHKMCLEDGMSKFRAWVVYKSVSMFGDPCADPSNSKPLRSAP